MTNNVDLLEQARSSDADVRQKAAVQVIRSLGDADLPLMFEMLGDRDWRVRKTIVEGFLRDPKESVIRGLLASLHDPENAGKRNSATEALVRIGDPVIPFVIYDLGRDTDPDVRLALVNLLGDLRNREAFDTLLKLLDEEDINILSSTVASLGKYRDVTAIPPLLTALRRDDLWLKFHVIEALGEIGDRSALSAVLPLYGEKSLRKPVLEAIGKIGDIGTVNFLLKIIAADEKLNLMALRALMQITEADKPRVVEAVERQLIQKKFRDEFPKSKIKSLIDHLELTPKPEVRNFILKFLGWSGDQHALSVLIDHLDLPENAEVAAQALIDFGPAATPSILEKLCNSDDDEVTGLVLRIINVIGGPEAIPTIIGFLDHDDPSIRRLAIETLGQIPDPKTIDYLLAKLEDHDVASQKAAVNSISALVAAFPEIKGETLGKIRRLLGSRSVPVKLNSLSIYVNIQGEGYHDELLLASKEDDPSIRQKAISLMGKFSEERFADQIVLSLADESSQVRLAAINAIVKLRPQNGIEPLISSLEDSDIWIRTAAAQALGEYRHPDSIAPLIRHLQSDSTPVKIAVVEALGKTGSDEVREVLFARLSEPDVEIQRAAVMALSRIPGEEVFAELMVKLRDPDWRIRAAAGLALGGRGDERALEAIHQALLHESDAYVLECVVSAVEKLGDRSSFPYLLKALETSAILDEISELFVKRKDLYRDLLEDAWKTADSRHEVIIAAILQAMKGSART